MSEETPIPEVKKANKTGLIPIADSDFGKVAAAVSDEWNKNAWLTLRWTTAAEFAAVTTAYIDALSARQSSGGTRPQVTKALKILNKEVDESVSFVKGYVVEKYKKDTAVSYYPAFGILYVDNKYVMPIDQSNREDSLTLMLEAIDANDFSDRTYGKTYWSDIKARYVALVKQARALDGGISKKVGNKNELKSSIKKGMNALINILQGNYPETYKQELRLWGFQKDKY
jgi:hypothetical protein